ncbi:hypothetical protein KTH44_09585 [Acinetobacter bereziniae]|uniref:DUF6714 family protein n=1 Tax=Acinetobacter bereziniae TaxID=106648 RepID=UPI0021CD6572|nr:DUF6714 family protein [Acinetobacter bereziniae]MCU4319379.1 hypothetical protein [Acinetobacter bereziniae]
MNADIKEQLEKTFPPFELGDNRSLLECDFYDTHHCYFDQIDDDYLSAVQVSAEGLLLEFGFDWSELYLQSGLQAARSRSRPNECIRTWKDVSYEYLYHFGQNCSFLSSEGFKFYLPAAIYHFLTTDQNKAFMDSFSVRLNTRWDKDNHVFSDAQKEFIIKFKRENC